MAITWSSTGSRSAKAVCTTGTESPPADGLTPAEGVGATISDAMGYHVVVEADSGQTLSGAGALRAYVWNPFSGVWGRAPALDLATTTASVRGLALGNLAIFAPRGRIAFVPNGVTLSSGSLTIYINVSFDKDGRAV
jgi:hypothetical protein